MRIIKEPRLREYAKQHSRAASSLRLWHNATRSASWGKFADVLQTFKSADQLTVSGRKVVVFNIGGGAFRLITAIHYNRGIVYIRKFMTHAEYSKDDSEKRPMTTTHLSLPAEAPESYEELVRLYPPRKIHDQIELEHATEVSDWIALRAKNDAQLDYLELLGDLMDEYENAGKADKASSPLELLNYLVEENDLTTRELGKVLGIDHSVAARILKGERAITVDHAKSLGARFKMDPKAFLKL